jgi:hypothetical protein
MPRRQYDARVYELAKRGAEGQFRDLMHEAKLLIDLFPHLRDAFDPDELPIKFIVAKGSGALTKTQGRHRRMSAAARRVVSVRMKKYWAARRKTTKV